MIRIVRHADLVKMAALRPVVAIGNFDGVHLGHQKVLRACRDKAREIGAPATVLTLSPHPRHYFNPQQPSLALCSLREKSLLLHAQGIDVLCIARFDQTLARMSAQAFIDNVLCAALGAQYIVTGSNFIFGAGRNGSTDSLQEAARQSKFGYSAIEPLLCPTRQVCSSSRIRAHLAAGEVPIASALLGRAYAIGGRVIHGDGRGKTLGFPTLNLHLGSLFLPALGVYAATVTTENAATTPLPAVVNLGIRPTFGGTRPMLEAHLLQNSGDYYGKRVKISLHRFLRPEQRFNSPDDLRRQIALDCQQAQQIIDSIAA